MDYSVGLHDFKILRCDFDFSNSYSDWSGLAFLNNFIDNQSTVQLPYTNGAGLTYEIPNKAYPIYNIEIGYCVFRNKFTGNDMINIAAPDSNIYFHYNKIFNLKTANEGLDIGGGSGHLIENNIISGIGGAGIKLHSQYNLFKNSIIRGNLIVRCGGDNGTDAAILFQNAENCELYNNTLVGRYPITLADRDRWAPYGYFGTLKNNKIYNNIFVGIIQVIGIWNNVVRDLTLKNQFYNNIYFPSGTGRGINLKYSSSPDNNMLQRYWDIVDNPLNSYEPQYKVGTKVYIGSSFASYWKIKTNNTELDADPLFVNPVWESPENYGNWNINENSPAFKTGVPVINFIKDLNGNKIPNSPNRGAFQPLSNSSSNSDFYLISAEFQNQNSIYLKFSSIIETSVNLNDQYFIFEPFLKIFSIRITSDQKGISLIVENPSKVDFIKLKIKEFKNNKGETLDTSDIVIPNSFKDEFSWFNKIEFNNSSSGVSLKRGFGLQALATDDKDNIFEEEELAFPDQTQELWAAFVNNNFYLSGDIRNSISEYTIWTIKLSGQFPIKLKWDSKKFPKNIFINLVDQIDGTLLNIDMIKHSIVFIETLLEFIKIIYKKIISCDISAYTGWNLVSLPVEPVENELSKIFNGASSKIFGYTSLGYYEVDSLEVGKGFWAKFDSTKKYNIEGFPSNVKKISVYKGWNLIGFNQAGSILNLQSNPPDLIESQLFSYNEAYSSCDEIQPGKGYWIKTKSDGEVFLTANKLNYNIEKIYKNKDISSFPKLIIEDSYQRKAQLFFSNEMSESPLAYLPPPPPGNTFDIRFNNDKRIARTDESIFVFLIGLVYPVKISVEGLDLELSDPLNGNILNKKLSEKETLELINYPFNKILVRPKRINYKYELFQNYPNPFNSRTIISFEIANPEKCELFIYDMLGRKIMTLFSGMLNEGRHDIELDASSLKSGVYVFILQTKNFSAAKKMVYLK